MKHKLILTCVLISGIFLSSCGTSKKLDAANAQVQQLQATNGELLAKQKDLQNQVNNLTTSYKTMNAEFSSYKSGCEATKQKLQAIQASMEEDNNTLEAVEKRIDAAVADFKNKGVEVYEENRMIYVDMEDNLLYKSGSAVVGDEGKKALAALASALNDYPKLKVTVVGHTDDQKFKNTNTDNLSLSTERANGVVRLLRDSYKVDPKRLTAAGKGKYDPIADNSTAEGRAKNRRTEIILNPDLLKLWENAQK